MHKWLHITECVRPATAWKVRSHRGAAKQLNAKKPAAAQATPAQEERSISRWPALWKSSDSNHGAFYKAPHTSVKCPKGHPYIRIIVFKSTHECHPMRRILLGHLSSTHSTLASAWLQFVLETHNLQREWIYGSYMINYMNEWWMNKVY